MAKVVEQQVIIKFSKLAKDSQKDAELVSADLIAQLEQIAEELAPDLVVEVVTKK